jgi:ABC-type iron transport system FetAB permease component
VTVASYTAGKRAKQVPRGKHIAFVSILVGTGTTMILLLLLKVFPFTPQYIIPISGMVIGNAMTVTGVAMKQLQQDIKTHKNLVSSEPPHSLALRTCCLFLSLNYCAIISIGYVLVGILVQSQLRNYMKISS